MSDRAGWLCEGKTNHTWECLISLFSQTQILIWLDGHLFTRPWLEDSFWGSQCLVPISHQYRERSDVGVRIMPSSHFLWLDQSYSLLTLSGISYSELKLWEASLHGLYYAKVCWMIPSHWHLYSIVVINQYNSECYILIQNTMSASFEYNITFQFIAFWVSYSICNNNDFFSIAVGWVIFAYYANKGCDPLEAGDISNSNQLLPHFIMNVVDYPAIPGLFFAAVVCGSLSSISRYDLLNHVKKHKGEITLHF